MSEELERKSIGNKKSVTYDLRATSVNDVEFLFRVSTEAMKPVDEALNPGKIFDREEEFKKYQAKFAPEDIKIITYKSEDVGRLKVVRGDDSIYIGGIQILPEFQGKGIGTAIFADLIKESDREGLPITLEVHDVNVGAIKFYADLGFERAGREEKKTHMKYLPASLKEK